jgi:hypothetical protein
MAVQIALTATQHTGLTASPVGSVATWMVTFELEGAEMIRTVVSVPIKGPPSHQEAQQQALKQLQVFLIEGGEATKNFQI